MHNMSTCYLLCICMMYPQFSRGKNDFSVQSIFQKVSCGQGNDSKMRVKWSEEGNNAEFQNHAQLKIVAVQFRDFLSIPRDFENT